MILTAEEYLPREYVSQPVESSRACEDQLREASMAELEKKIARLQHLVAELLAVNQQLREQLET